MKTVAFIGLGRMGRPMAGHLARAGVRLRLHDRDVERTAAVAAETGGAACANAASAARGAQVLITMLPDGAAVRGVLVGAGAAAEALEPGSIVIDMSSSDPLGTRALGALLKAREIALLDAPVSGGVAKAESAELSIMIGGDAAVLDEVRPLLEAMGKQLFVAGSLGAGHAVKALNNYVSAAGLAALCEALLAARAFGLDPDTVTDILNASSGRNNATEVKAKRFMIPQNFVSGFSAGLMAKDVATAARLAEALGVEAPTAQQVSALWRDASRALGPDADHTALYRYIGELKKR